MEIITKDNKVNIKEICNENILITDREEKLFDNSAYMLKRLLQKAQQGDTGENVAKSMSNMVNSFSNKEQEHFINTMLREHRTLQQNFTRLCCEWLKALAQEKNYDARNEASVKLAKEFVKMDYQLPFI